MGPLPGDLSGDLEELVELSTLRTSSQALVLTTGARPRLPISSFLQLRTQPLGAVYDVSPGRGGPVIMNGRELARWFESETPGLGHEHALNHIFGNPNIADPKIYTPPKQALVWAALRLSIYAGLLAAWHYKWDDPNTNLKPRPIECAAAGTLSVLFDTKSGPNNATDSLTPSNPNPFPGTPRHPSYPSGPSTAAGAGSAVLAKIFPEFETEFMNLEDNAGMARLWAGVHYRSDHMFGVELGKAVAGLVLKQLPPGILGSNPQIL